jgi:ADP-L-glycero-D-manno-heptose 6-epimerase
VEQIYNYGFIHLNLKAKQILNMIIVTGAAGFIGSCLVAKLNAEGFRDVVIVDDYSLPEKNKNLNNKEFTRQVHREQFPAWLEHNHKLVQFVFHLGARTDTAEFDRELLNHLNLEYSKNVWKSCVEYGLPLVYASSAATYGLGENGYEDNEAMLPLLKPLNPYGESKNDFDNWAVVQEKKPWFWVGLKFFNVYGPNEYHKGRMASVIYHAYRQITATGRMKLFRSHHPGFKDGEQMRDFIYVKDLVDTCYFFLHHRRDNGIYNLGTGRARTFVDLALATFSALGQESQIDFIDTPEDIREKYQYFTEAKMNKLRSVGYIKPFSSLESGVKDYVQNYLLPQRYL